MILLRIEKNDLVKYKNEFYVVFKIYSETFRGVNNEIVVNRSFTLYCPIRDDICRTGYGEEKDLQLIFKKDYVDKFYHFLNREQVSTNKNADEIIQAYLVHLETTKSDVKLQYEYEDSIDGYLDCYIDIRTKESIFGSSKIFELSKKVMIDSLKTFLQ